METEGFDATSNGKLNHPDNQSRLRDEDDLDMSIDAENPCNETKVSCIPDDANGDVDGDNACEADNSHHDLEQNVEVSGDPNVSGNDFERSPAPVKKKRRRSSAKNISFGDGSDGTSRYGRTLKPKHDDEHFIPTEAVLGKSPRKSRKSVEATSTPISGIKPKAMTTPSNLNGSLNDTFDAGNEFDDIGNLSDDLKAVREAEVIKESPEEASTEYEPGDLLWGRLGHHPFWPCIVMCDPVNNVYYKKSGRRLSYHVMFYADNGKRSWVTSAMVIRFLGLAEFQMQVAGISKESKKNNPKWFSGFFVKATTKPKWEEAAREAEEVMPLTRDERLDAFLSSMPSKGRKSKTLDEVIEGEDYDADGTLDEGNSVRENGAVGSPSSALKKRKLVPKIESPSTGKKKRGRPRKIDVSLTQSEHLTPDPAAKGSSGPGRPRKRKLLVEDQATNGETDDESDDKPTKKLRRRKPTSSGVKELENGERTARLQAQAFTQFSEINLERLKDEFPDMTEKQAKEYLLLLWDKKTDLEKQEYLPLVHVLKPGDESAEEDEDSGIEEEVATVASADTAKEFTGDNDDEQPVIIAKKKINLFRGYKIARVCQGCEKPGNTVKCRGPCAGVFHVECARGADNAGGSFRIVKDEDNGKLKRRGRKKKVDSTIYVQAAPKSREVTRQKKIYADEGTDSDLDYDDGETIPEVCDDDAIMKMILGDSSAIPEVAVLDQKESSDDEDDSEDPSQEIQSSSPIDVSSIADFRCGDCAVLRTPLCFVCGQATDPTGEDSVRIRCSVAHCGKHYHIECLKVLWPQANYPSIKGVIQSLTCPQHVCHTCVSDNPRDSKGRFSHEKLVRCIRCPTSYHYGNYCVPAGSEILTASQMICPRHYEPPKKGIHHINASWCFICSIGGSLICCDLCPSSFHIDCLKIKPPTGSYICEDCETGRYPLYNEVLWVKLGVYRWWPALSLFPSEVPDNVESRPHKMGEFAVRFLGTNDHYWIDRGRCYVYHEGDGSMTNKTAKSHMESSYQRGLLEAKELHKAHKELRASVQALSKPASMKPPSYTKIKSNKPVGSIKMLEVDTSNISPCECDPNSDHPCSPDSECLNRILLVECDPNICPAGEKCENQCFGKRIYPASAPCYTDGRGWGLQILEDLKKGAFVIEYVGEVIDDQEYEKRLKVKHEDKDENYYFLTIDSTRIIDAGPKGNVSRFMNHSCQPNCETQKWTVAGDTRVGLFALCDIPAGTELTFNYNLESKGNDKKPCMCGTSVCSGFIGAKKNKVPQSDMKEPLSGKKKRRKPRVRNLIEDVCLLCDADKEAGALMSCINKECASKYHLPCLGLTSTPRGKWLCPRHRCNVCQERTQHWCSYCTESYCGVHVDGNLVNDPLHGDICETHQKNPLSKDHFKKKREEVIKRREEEKLKIEECKRKQYEEERARRRSRREQINGEETSKAKQSSSDLDDAGSEVSSNCGDKLNEANTEEALGGSDGVAKRGHTIKEEGEKHRLSSKALSSDMLSDTRSPKAPSKRGRKRKVIPSEAPSPHQSSGVTDTVVNGAIQRTVENCSYGLSLSAAGEKSQAGAPDFNDLGEDEIPDADPTLDKFMVQVPAPIDDDPSPEAKKKKTSSPPRGKDLLKEASPSSITKRRRKPPMHKDFINIQNLNLNTLKDSTPDKLQKLTPGRKPSVKKNRESNFDKAGLNDQLEELVAGFASDEGQETYKFSTKTQCVRGKGKRLGMGTIRSQVTDSMTSAKISHSGSKVNPASSSPNHIKSPVSALGSPISDTSILGSPEKLSASKIFAMQRAKGFKVMPPNRRLSLAREQALAGRMGDGALDKIERSAKGLKVLRGRPPSAESSPSEKKTENLHGEVLLSVPVKKTRPVLLKVQDNGVNLDDDLEDKVVDNGALPKQTQPHPMQSPPIKKAISTSQKQTPSIGLGSSLWNQDILNIIT